MVSASRWVEFFKAGGKKQSSLLIHAQTALICMRRDQTVEQHSLKAGEKGTCVHRQGIMRHKHR